MSHMRRVVTVVATLGFIFNSLALATADTNVVTPKGEYAKIDTRLANETIQILAKGTPEDRQKVIETIKANPGNYAPPVFYTLSQILFLDGKKDEAAFWFYAGQLRARVDANICADSSARQAVGVLNRNYGTPINQYAFQDIPKLEELVPRVVDWERRTPYSYDRRWINLHGMGAMMSGLNAKTQDASQTSVSFPKDQWNDIAEKTRTDYLADFRKAITQAPQSSANTSFTAVSESNNAFSDKPYSINLKTISALDPKPLKIETFSPDPFPRAQGVRIISTGRIFPISYEIISIRDTTNQNILGAVSKSLDSHSDIILKEEKSNSKLENYIHYFQRVTVNGKPHHVSANYIFVKNNTFYHLAANNYAAAVMPRDSWGPDKPDANAENEVMSLVNAFEFR